MKVRVYESTAAAIRAGLEPHNSYFFVDVDLTALTTEERAELALTGQDGDTEHRYGETIGLDTIASPEAVKTWLQNHKSKREQDNNDCKLRYEDEIARLLSLPQAEFNAAYVPHFIENDPRLADKMKAKQEAKEAEKAAEKAAMLKEKEDKEKKRKEEEAEKEASGAARTAQMVAWVSKHGTQNQKERLEAGLLPELEMLEGIESDCWRPLSDLPPYEPLFSSEINHKDDCDYEYDKTVVKFRSYDAEVATDTEWDDFKAVQSRVLELYPDAEVSLRQHQGHCTSCDQSEYKMAVRVTVKTGVLSFTRSFAV